MRRSFLLFLGCSIFLQAILACPNKLNAEEREAKSLRELDKQGWELVWENSQTRVFIHPKYIKPIKEQEGYDLVVKFSPGPDIEKKLKEKLENLKKELFSNEEEIPEYWNDFVKEYIENGNSYVYNFSLLCQDKKLILRSVRGGELFSNIAQVDVKEDGYGKAIFQKLCNK